MTPKTLQKLLEHGTLQITMDLENKGKKSP